MRDTKAVTLAPAQEGAFLFKAFFGRECPVDLASAYAAWLAGDAPLTLPAIIYRHPALLRLLEPLPGRPDFDRRRRALMTLAESHPTTATLFYKTKNSSRAADLLFFVLALAREVILFPLRAFAGCLWK